MKKFHVLALCLILLFSGCVKKMPITVSEKPKAVNAGEIQFIEVPGNVLKINDKIAAFYVKETGSKASAKQNIPTKNLNLKIGETVELFEYTGDSLIYVPSKQNDSTVSAELKNGSTYVFSARPSAELGRAFRWYCTYAGQRLRADPLCPAIFCPDDIIRRLAGKLPPVNDRLKELNIDELEMSNLKMIRLGGSSGGICGKCFGNGTLIPVVECTPDFTPPQGIPEDTSKIVFRSDRTGLYDLFSVLPDGSSLKNLTNTPNAEESWPSWAPDGRSLVYVTDPKSSPSDTYGWDMSLVVMDESGENKIVLDYGAPFFMPQWSPSGNRITYLKKMPNKELYTVTKNPDGTWSDPQLSCQSSTEFANIRGRFMFYEEDSIIFDGMNPINIFRASLSSGTSSCPIEEINPVVFSGYNYFPDVTVGGKIALVKYTDYIGDIYTIPSFGEFDADAQYTTHSRFPYYLSWSNDGKKISYEIDSGTGGLRIINTTTNVETVLNSTLSVRTHVSLGHGIASPQYWSPDDKKILFIGVPEGMLVEKHEVYVVDIANDTVLNISNDSNAMDTSAIWQPRGH